MGRLFKIILAPFNFLGILFGGIVDFIAGAFKGSESEEPATPNLSAPPPNPQPASQPSGTPVMSTPTVAASSPSRSTESLRSQPSAPVNVETPFDVNAVPRPRPTRRPGKSLTMFKLMARDLQMGN